MSMKKAKLVQLIGAVLLLSLLALSLTLIFVRPNIFAAATTKTGTTSPTETPHTALKPSQLQLKQHVTLVTPTPTPPPTPTPAPPAAAPTQSTTASNSSEPDRYFPAGTSVDAIKAGGANLTKQQVKILIEGQVDEHWAIIASTFGFTAKEQAYAFFLGMATRESTLDAGLETGSGSAHSYGPLQASETAYNNANPSYSPETDVPEMIMYDYTPENYYDPGISVHMGIRHLIHFAHSASAAGYSGVELLRHALVGYNTGHVETSDQNLLQQYSDEIGALAGWYLSTGHLYDTIWTWTGDPRVNRSSPWGWV